MYEQTEVLACQVAELQSEVLRLDAKFINLLEITKQLQDNQEQLLSMIKVKKK